MAKIKWFKLQYEYPEAVEDFYDWLAISATTDKFEFTFSKYFRMSAWLQVAVFYEYLKDSMVDVVEVNPLDLVECVSFVEEYFKGETEKKQHISFLLKSTIDPAQ